MTRRISNFLKKVSNGRTVGQLGTEPCSGASRFADTQTLPGHTGQLERDLSNTKSPTSVPHSSFEELRGKKSRFSKRQSRSLGAVNSVNAGYLPVGKQTKRNRSISGNKGGRVNNQISLFPSVSTNIRRHNQAGEGIQNLDNDSTQLCEKSLDVSHRRNPLSSTTSSISTKRNRKFLSRYYPKRRNIKYRRGRGILSSGARSWRAISFHIRKFSKFLYKPAGQYSDTQQTSDVDPQIGTVTTLQSIPTENDQTRTRQFSEQIRTFSEKGLVNSQDNESGSSNSIQENNKGIEENILVNDPTSLQHNSRRSSVASEQGKCTEQPIRSLTGVNRRSQSSSSVPRIEHNRESNRSAEGIQQSSEHLHHAQAVEKEQTINKGQPESERRNSGAGFFSGRLNCTRLYEGAQPDNSRSDNSSRIRHVELDKQRQFLQTFEISSQPLADSENNKSPTIDKNNSSLAPVTDIKMNTPKFAAASDLSAFQRDQHVRSGLQSLNSFTGGSLQRFDIWLETFEAIIVDSGMTEKDIVLELYKKMSEKAQRIMKYILSNGDDSYKSIRERLLDHFHGDETREKSLKKF